MLDEKLHMLGFILVLFFKKLPKSEDFAISDDYIAAEKLHQNLSDCNPF